MVKKSSPIIPRSLALIWDMDGTLVDSYPAIVPSVREVLAELGYLLDEEQIHAEVIGSSVKAMLERLAAERGLDPALLYSTFNRLNDTRIDVIRPMPHCMETLERLQKAGHRNYVYTHRGQSCAAILTNTGLAPFFTEVVSALHGFPRKPEPDGILYLIDKYDLDPRDCFYVGDRSLDVEAAERAGIGSILYLDSSSPGKADGRASFVVRDLHEIPALAEELRHRHFAE